MKKFLLILSAGAVCFFTSCGGKKEEGSGGMSAKAKANLAASKIVSDALMSGDISKIDSAVASDFVDHTDKGDMGRDSLKAMITMMHKSGGDMKMETVKEFADDEYVVSWMRYSGSNGESMGMPKGPYDMKSIEVVKCKDGKAVEHWEYMNPADMMKMMGAMPPADHKPKKDTADTKDVKTTD